MKKGNQYLFLIISLACAFILFFAAAFWNDLKKPAVKSPKVYSSTLYVFPGAEQVKYDQEHGIENVKYDLKMSYPAQPFLTQSSTYFISLGYSPSAADSTLASFDAIKGLNVAEQHPLRVEKLAYKKDIYWKGTDNSRICSSYIYSQDIESEHANLQKMKVQVTYYPARTIKSGMVMIDISKTSKR